MTFESAVEFVRNWSNEAPPWDLVGVTSLMLAAVDNLCENHTSDDFGRIRSMLDDHHLQFLKAVIDAAPDDS